MHKFLYLILLSSFVLSLPPVSKSLDTGEPPPIVKEYTKEDVSAYIGQKVTVSYTNEGIDDIVTLQILGVLWDRFKKGDRYLLLGYTQFKNRMVIPIEKIHDIEVIE